MLKKKLKVSLLLLFVFAISCESNNDFIEKENTIENSEQALDLVKKSSSKELSSIQLGPLPSMQGVHIKLNDYFSIPGSNPNPEFPFGQKFLSSTRNGDIVDLYPVDDNSGRQKWNLVRHYENNGGYNYYHIIISGGVRGGKKYLSSTSDGGKIDLYHYDDGSGRQRWIIEDLPFTPEGVYRISILGGITPSLKKRLVRHKARGHHTQHVELKQYLAGVYDTWNIHLAPNN